MSRQCSSCGGFCKPSGCERENVEAKSAVSEEPVGYWQGKFSLDGGATLYEVPQVSAFGRSYPNIPLWEHPAPAVVRQLVEALEHCSGWVEAYGRSEARRKVRAALAAAKEAGL